MAVYANELRESDAVTVHMLLQLTLRHQRCDTNDQQHIYDTIRCDTLYLHAPEADKVQLNLPH